MAEFLPFRALRYDERVAGSLSDVICPPYDVISDAQREELYARSPFNLVRVEAGRDEPGDDPERSRYQRSAATLAEWRAAGALRTDEAPTLYLDDHEFRVEGQQLRRRGVYGALRLYDEAAATVMPHELTFAKARTDRLRLLRATRLNVSPVFGMFEDDSGEVAQMLRAALDADGAPLIGEARVGEDAHRLHALADAALTSELSRLLADKRIYIADGHHRYATALQHHQESGAGGPGYVLTYLCSLDDPGLRIFGTHRIVHRDGGAVDRAIAAQFDAAPIDRGAVGDIQPGIVLVRDGTFTELRPKKDADLSTLREAWRPLPVAQAELLLEPARQAGATIGYEHDMDKAIAAAQGDSSTLLIRAVDPATLRDVADAGERLPQKTTYFYPKAPAGLVLRESA